MHLCRSDEGLSVEHGEQARPGHAQDHSAAHVLGYVSSSVFASCETPCSSNRPDVLEGESRIQTFVYSFCFLGEICWAAQTRRS